MLAKRVFGVFVQPVAGSHPSSVQRSPSSQVGAAPCMQKPPWQLSMPLHALPSLQAPGRCSQCAAPGPSTTQASVVSQLPSSHWGGVLSTQKPCALHTEKPHARAGSQSVSIAHGRQPRTRQQPTRIDLVRELPEDLRRDRHIRVAFDIERAPGSTGLGTFVSII